MIKKLIKCYSTKARSRRGELFRNCLKPSEQDRILDLGGGNGSHIASILPYRSSVYVADIDADDLRFARRQFGFNTIQIAESGPLPFPDGCFDIVFCSSVIEHATVAKSDLQSFRTGREFSKAAYARQSELAVEIQRISNRYFVQTPNKYFFIESHTWMPFCIVFLPRRWQIALIKSLNMSKWPKKTSPDWNLLTRKQMQDLFPDAQIVLEKFYGFNKSIIAIKDD